MIRFAWSGVRSILVIGFLDNVEDTWNFFTKNAGNLLGNLSMLQLCLRPTPHLEVVKPATESPTHIEPGRTVDGKDLPGTLLCNS